MGLEGPAYVTAVGACPEIETGPGRVVLTTVTHLNAHVLHIYLAGQDEPLRPTDTHPLYSEDRQGWIPAGELTVGEHLRTLAGPQAIVRIERDPRVRRVYNLEVDTDHCFYAGPSGVLSHNFGTCAVAVSRMAAGIALNELLFTGAEHLGIDPIWVTRIQVGLGLGRGLGRGLRGGAAWIGASGKGRTSRGLTQKATRRLAKKQGEIPRSAQPTAQGRFGKGTKWWEYTDSHGNRIIVVEHPDGSVHVGRPKPQSQHLDGSWPPKYYPLPGTGHVGE